MSPADLSSASLGDIAYRRLKSQIVECSMRPGQRVTERQLAALLGLGISPIREALTRLDHEGLVHTLPRRGYEVTRLTMKSIDDLFEYWLILGPEMVRHGVRGASDQQITAIRDHFREVEQLFLEGNRPDLNHRASAIVDDAFEVLAEATGNQYILGAFGRLSGEISRVRALVLDADRAESDYFMSQVPNWDDVLARRDADGAAAITKAYIESGHHRCLRRLARWPGILSDESSDRRLRRTSIE